MSDGPSPFDLVMGSREDAIRRSDENFEHQCVKQLLRGLGMPPKRLASLERSIEGGFSCEWFTAEYPEWPGHLEACRVREYSLQGLFERPATNPVMESFLERFGKAPDAPCAMIFRAAGWTKLVMERGSEWITEQHNYLNLCVHRARYRVLPLEEFINAYPQRFLAPEAV